MFYLAQKYRGIEMESFMNACKWTKQLLDKGYFVFSPILHSHTFSLTVGNKIKGVSCYKSHNCPVTEISLQKDCLQVDDICKYKKTIDESGIDWLEWDLKICEALHKEDGCIRSIKHYYCKNCHKELKWKHIRHELIKCDCGITYNQYISFGDVYNDYLIEFEQKEIFDSVLTMIFAPDCCNFLNKQAIDWYSKGAETEYNWAKKHYVKCVLLEDVLNKPENKWRAI